MYKSLQDRKHIYSFIAITKAYIYEIKLNRTKNRLNS